MAEHDSAPILAMALKKVHGGAPMPEAGPHDASAHDVPLGLKEAIKTFWTHCHSGDFDGAAQSFVTMKSLADDDDDEDDKGSSPAAGNEGTEGPEA